MRIRIWIRKNGPDPQHWFLQKELDNYKINEIFYGSNISNEKDDSDQDDDIIQYKDGDDGEEDKEILQGVGDLGEMLPCSLSRPLSDSCFSQEGTI